MLNVEYDEEGYVKSINGLEIRKDYSKALKRVKDNIVHITNNWYYDNPDIDLSNPGMYYGRITQYFSGGRLFYNPVTKEFVATKNTDFPTVTLLYKFENIDYVNDIMIPKDWVKDIDCVPDATVLNNRRYIIRELAVDIGEGNYVKKSDKNNYSLCKICHKVFYTHYGNEREQLCNVCSADSHGYITGYHEHRRLGLHPFFDDNCDETNSDNFAGYGIELETELRPGYEESKSTISSIKSILGNHIYYERDGSLCNGFEHITRPHTYEGMLKLNWKDYLQKLIDNNYRSHIGGRCGLHIHASRTLFGKDDASRENAIAKLLCFYAMYIEDIKKFSRRNSYGYCRINYTSDDKDTNIEKAKFSNKSNYNRFDAINLTNDNTIEFRIARGTLKYETFMATFKFTAHLVKKCTELDWDAISDYHNWLDGLDDDTLAYLKKRHCFNLSNSDTNPRAVGEV